LTLKIPIIDS